MSVSSLLLAGRRRSAGASVATWIGRLPIPPRRLALSLAAGLLLGAGLSTASVLAAGDVFTRASEQVLVTIPAGTADRIARGEPGPAIPADLRFVAGDTFVLRNEDVAAHRIGGYVVAPGATLRVPLATADAGTFVCTFHPSGAIGLDVRGRPDPLSLILVTLLVGLPVGVVLAVVATVVSRLDGPGGDAHA